MVVFLTEIMPVDFRTTGFAFAYSCATAAFGGFTPAICTYLIHVTGNRAPLWLQTVLGAATCCRDVLIGSTLRSSMLVEQTYKREKLHH
jgi:uncharacterized membrane protein